MSKIPVYDINGKKVDDFQLPEAIFKGRVNSQLLHQAVCMYRANQRSGSASTKNRAAVRGGGKKPWRQKGTGRARFGSIRNPLWKGGGVAFGPHPRDYSYTLPRKMKKKALVSALASKFNEKQALVVKDLILRETKTKLVRKFLDKLNVDKSAVMVSDKFDPSLKRASRNIPGVIVKEAATLTCYDLLSHDKAIISKGALDLLIKEFKK